MKPTEPNLNESQPLEQHEATAVEETLSRTSMLEIRICTTNKTGKSVHSFEPASKKKKKKLTPYNSQHATSEGAQRVAHGSAVANPKVYFSVINGRLINRAQCAMQMLQGSYSD